MSRVKKQLDESRAYFLVFQLPLSLIQGSLALSLLVRSITRPLTRIHHFYLWITLCLVCALAWITVFVSIFSHNTLHKMSIPSRLSTWLIRMLHTLWLLSFSAAIIIATTPISCQNISYCAQHRAVIVFSFASSILLLLGSSGLHGTVNLVSSDQRYIPGADDAAPGDEDPSTNPPANVDESQDSNQPMDGPMEEDSKECSEKHVEMETVDLEKGQNYCAMCKGRLDGA